MQMRVNVARQTLKFAVNQGEFKKLATIQKSKTPYYLAIGIFNERDQIKLTNCTFPESKEEEEMKENAVMSFIAIHSTSVRSFQLDSKLHI